MTLDNISPRLITATLGVALTVFAFDLMTPLGVAGGVPYVVAVLVAAQSAERRFVLAVAGVTSALTFAGFFVSTEGAEQWIAVVNRALGVFVIWVTAVVSLQLLRWEAEKATAHLASIVESSGDAILSMDLDRTITSWNAAAAQMYGYQPSEAIGQPISLIVPEDLEQELLELLDSVREGGRVDQVETKRTTKSGKLVDVSLTLSPLQNVLGDVVGFSAIKRDISERKKAQERLADSEGRLQRMNETLEQQVSDRTAELQLQVAERERAQEALRQTAEDSAMLANVSRITTSSLEIRDFYEQFAELIRNMIPSDQVDIATADPAAGTVYNEYWSGSVTPNSPAAPRPWEGSIAEAVCKRGHGLLILPSDEAEVEQRYPFVLASYRNGFRSLIAVPMLLQGECTGLFVLASTRENAYTENQLQLAERVIAQIGGAISNAKLHSEVVETRHRLEETLIELRQTQEQVDRQERLRSLGNMASGIAHDFNNALGPILGYSDLLLTYPETLAEEETATSYIKDINTAAKDAQEVVGRLNEFYRHRDDFQVETKVDLNKIIAEAISLSRPRWREMTQANGISVNIHTDLNDDVPYIFGREASLRTALINLIMNAVDAMPQGGNITIYTSLDGDKVILGVADTGMGMTEEVRKRAAEPFFSTKDDEGAGLGLAMVFGVAQSHDGSMELDSTPGEGAAVVLRLPIEKSEEPKEVPSPPVATDELEHGLNILVADDEAPMRDLLVDYLKKDGHTVETAVNGLAAMETFKDGNFELVITDRAMPEMGGDQLALNVKSVASEVPVIMITGFGGMMVSSGEHPPGVDLVVSKPITIGGLRDAIKQVFSE